MAKCCHALRTHQHAQGGRVAARPSGRGNEAASEPSIYSVRTVERIIGHSLHTGRAEEAEQRKRSRSERGGGLSAFPRWLRPDTFQVESILGVRRSFCILSAPSSTVSLHILSRSLASLSCSRPLVHMPRHMCSPLLYQSVLAIYSPCEVAVLLHHRSVPPSKIVARGKAALFIRAVILQSLCRAHM